MDRRDFLLTTSIAALAAPAIGASAKGPEGDSEFALSDIAAAYADGRLTAQRLTQFYLDRIQRIDRNVRRILRHA